MYILIYIYIYLVSKSVSHCVKTCILKYTKWMDHVCYKDCIIWYKTHLTVDSYGVGDTNVISQLISTKVIFYQNINLNGIIKLMPHDTTGMVCSMQG